MSQALLLSSSPSSLRPTSPAALTPFERGARALADDSVAGPLAVVATPALEADVAGGPQPQQGEAPWLSRPTVLQALLPSSPPLPPLRPTSSPALIPFERDALALATDGVAGPLAVAAAAATLEADVAGGPHPQQGEAPWLSWPRASQALLLLLLTLSSLTPTLAAALIPFGRGALAFVADGVAGPPAIVIAAALEVDVAGGPHPQQGDTPWLSRPTA